MQTSETKIKLFPLHERSNFIVDECPNEEWHIMGNVVLLCCMTHEYRRKCYGTNGHRNSITVTEFNILI